MSPVRIAITLNKVAIRIATAEPKINNHDAALTVCHSTPINIIPANKVLPIAVASTTVTVGTVLVSFRVAISLIVTKTIADKAESE